MAGELKPSGFFIFDKQHSGAIAAKEERPNLLKRIRHFIRSRFAILSIVFLLAGSMIFYNTAALQLNPASASGISEERLRIGS